MVRVAIAYTIVGWLLIQVLELAASSFEAPAWVMKMIITIIAIGFIPTVIFSWAYEMTPDGIKREQDVERDDSITHLTGKKLDFIAVGAAVCVAAMFAWELLVSDSSPQTRPVISEEPQEEVRVLATVARLGSQSIAVLPFANRSNRDDDLFFTDGIHDDLLTQLSKIHDLKVTSRTSVMDYRSSPKRIPEIAVELGVATVLTGSVQRAGDRVRINAQLIDVATDRNVWAETFDREMTIENLFDIQKEITIQIASAVTGQLSAEDRDSLSDAPTQNIAAYDAFLKAREILAGDYSMESYNNAQPLVEAALALDSGFAEAWLLLAEIHGQAAWIGFDDTPERRQEAADALDRAESLLGPDSPELSAARGEFYYRFEENYPAALNAQLKALVRMPGNSTVIQQIGLTQRRMGLWEEALASFQQSGELDPGNPFNVSLQADTLLAMKDWPRMNAVVTAAREQFPDDVDLALAEVLMTLRSSGEIEKARELYAAIPTNPGEYYFLVATELPWFSGDIEAVHAVWNQQEILQAAANTGWAGVRDLNLAMAHLQNDEIDSANRLLDQVIRDLSDDNSEARGSAAASELGVLAIALALKGDRDTAIRKAEEATNIVSAATDRLDGLQPLLRLAKVLAIVGERDRALELLEDQLTTPGGVTAWELQLDARWNFFRDDERFAALATPDPVEVLAQ